MKRYSFAAAAAALSIVLASCSSSKTDKKTSAPPTGPATAAAVSSSGSGSIVPISGGITIRDFAFSGTMTVKPGQKVTVTNKDSMAHTLTDKGGKFDAGNIDGNATATFTAPTAPGSYQIICKYHSNMHGTVIVKA